MNPQHLMNFAYALGLSTVAWVVATTGSDHVLVTLMTVLIGGVFTWGMLELRRHRSALMQVRGSLDHLPQSAADFESWMATLPLSWRSPVRERVEGRSMALPVLALTPYLVGLLVMLGMLGTFLGMLASLSGTAFALNSLNDIQGIRDAFARPIQGLGLAFGASVAGVATSALLGLMSTWVRRERAELWLRMDSEAESLAMFSNRYRQIQQWEELLTNSRALPEWLSQMNVWMTRMQDLQSQLNEQWLARQSQHHQEIAQAHQVQALALSKALSEQWTHTTGQTVNSLQTLEQRLAERWADTTGQTVNSLQTLEQRLAERWADTTGQTVNSLQTLEQRLAEQWTHTTAQTVNSLQTLEQRLAERWADTTGQTVSGLQAMGEALQQGLTDAARQTGEHIQRMSQDQLSRMGEHTQNTQQQLQQAFADWWQQHQDQNLQHLARIDARLVEHLAQWGTSLQAPLSDLMQVASQSSQTAAELIGSLRQRVEDSMARDHELLQERTRTLAQLSQVSQVWGEQVKAQGQQWRDLSAQIQAASLDVAQLGASFAQSVETWRQTQERTMTQLGDLQQSLAEASSRSDDQLAYYIAQAREVVELSLSAQQPLLEALERVVDRPQAEQETA